MNKRLLYYSGMISVTAIIMAHMITGVYLYREECLASGTLQGLEAAIMDIVCSPEPF